MTFCRDAACFSLLCGALGMLGGCVDESPRFQAGSLANDVALTACGETQVALVPASGDGTLDVFALPDGRLLRSVRFDGAVPAEPFAVAVDEQTAVVTLRGRHAFADVAFCAGRIDAVHAPRDLVEVSPPLRLRAPQDADGDGDEELDVTAMRPRAPQAVAGGVVAFTNLLEVGLSAAQPPRLGPGLLARADDTALLPCINPQGVTADDDELWISCTGPLGPDETGAQVALDDGALVVVDDTLEPIRTIAVGRFAPGTAAVVRDRVVVGSVVTPRIACLPRSAATFDDADIIELDGPAVDSVFRVVPFDDERVLALQFSADAIQVVDVERCRVSQTIAVGPGGTGFRGALALDVRPGARPYDAVALLALSAEVVPLKLFEVLE